MPSAGGFKAAFSARRDMKRNENYTEREEGKWVGRTGADTLFCPKRKTHGVLMKERGRGEGTLILQQVLETGIAASGWQICSTKFKEVHSQQQFSKDAEIIDEVRKVLHFFQKKKKIEEEWK